MELQEARTLFQQAMEFNNKNDIDAAIKLWSQIEKTSEELGDICARAQMNLGDLLIKKQNINAAKQAYENIKAEDSPFLYAWAQLKLYSNFGEDKEYLKKIKKQHDLSMYAEARFKLGSLESNLDLKNCLWQEIPKESSQYIQELYKINIVHDIAKLKGSFIKEKLFNIFEIIEKILNKLFVFNRYEHSLAHYTDVKVAKWLLTNKNDNKEEKFEAKTKLRLGIVYLMNDPEEGLMLEKLFSLDDSINTQDIAFTTCFTLHQDSLNQFRLYGKQNLQEASGVSFVLHRKFFDVNNTVSGVNHKYNLISESLEDKASTKDSLSVRPLYRCIYIDPTSGLIKVAQREEWSFHREYKAENKQHMFDENLEAEQNWKEYQAEILQIESEVKTHLKELAEQVKCLNPKKLNDEEKELLAEILLPLRYLVKHMAFKEEQECRMIYVTQMDNPLIKYDEKINRIYIDYELSVMEHLEKIYLAPKAKDEKMVFEYLCSRGQEVRKGKPHVKVKISQNPFR